jgi:hypothetical protein
VRVLVATAHPSRQATLFARRFGQDAVTVGPDETTVLTLNGGGGPDLGADHDRDDAARSLAAGSHGPDVGKRDPAPPKEKPVARNLVPITLAELTMIFVILVTSHDLLIGTAGFVLPGHAAFYPIGACTAAIISLQVDA